MGTKPKKPKSLTKTELKHMEKLAYPHYTDLSAAISATIPKNNSDIDLYSWLEGFQAALWEIAKGYALREMQECKKVLQCKNTSTPPSSTISSDAQSSSSIATSKAIESMENL